MHFCEHEGNAKRVRMKPRAYARVRGQACRPGGGGICSSCAISVVPTPADDGLLSSDGSAFAAPIIWGRRYVHDGDVKLEDEGTIAACFSRGRGGPAGQWIAGHGVAFWGNVWWGLCR